MKPVTDGSELLFGPRRRPCRRTFHAGLVVEFHSWLVLAPFLLCKRNRVVFYDKPKRPFFFMSFNDLEFMFGVMLSNSVEVIFLFIYFHFEKFFFTVI